MLTIWGRLNSHNVKKVAWFAVELGLPFERHDVGGKFGMDAAYLANLAASVVVAKLGTYAVSKEELLAALK